MRFQCGVGLAVFLSIGTAWADQSSTATVSSGQTFTVASDPLGGVIGCSIQTGSHAYGTTSFTTGLAGNYTFEVTGGSGVVASDSFLAVYQGSFDPLNPTLNLVGCDDDAGVGQNPLLSASLRASTTYIAVATSYYSGTQSGTVDFLTGADATISLSNQTIAMGTANPTMTATSNSPVAITYTSSNAAVATIDPSTGALTLVGPGTTTITASQAAQTAPGLFRAGTKTAVLTVATPLRASIGQAIDATVKGTVSAHLMSTQRFAQVQLDNVGQRLQQLGISGFDLQANRMALRLNDPNWQALQQVRGVLQAATGQAGTQLPGVTQTTVSDAPEQGEPALRLLAQTKSDVPSIATTREVSDESLYAVWVAGGVGRGRAQIDSGSNRFTSEGLTLGLDLRLAPRTIVGVALGHGKERTRVDEQGTLVDAQQTAVSLYGITQLNDTWLLDAQLGQGSLAFDNRRFSSFNAVMLSSERSGRSIFGALGLSAPMKLDAWQVQPYARLSASQAKLDAYAETGDTSALSFARAKSEQQSLQLGARVQRVLNWQGTGRWAVEGRGELRRNANSGLTQHVSYTDTPSESGSLQLIGLARNVATLGVGLRYSLPRGWSAGVSLESQQGSGGQRAERLAMQVNLPL